MDVRTNDTVMTLPQIDQNDGSQNNSSSLISPKKSVKSYNLKNCNGAQLIVPNHHQVIETMSKKENMMGKEFPIRIFNDAASIDTIPSQGSVRNNDNGTTTSTCNTTIQSEFENTANKRDDIIYKKHSSEASLPLHDTSNHSNISSIYQSSPRETKSTQEGALQKIITTSSNTSSGIAQHRPMISVSDDAVSSISSSFPSSSSCNLAKSEEGTRSLGEAFSAPSSTTSASLNGAPNCKRSRSSKEQPEKPIPVFDHILLLPPAFHKLRKGESLPSNYLTPEEEATQARELWSRRQKRAREEKRRRKKMQLIAKAPSTDDEYVIGRSGRKRKKTKLYADYVMEKEVESARQGEDESVDDSSEYESSDDDTDSYDVGDEEEDSVLSYEDESELNSSLSEGMSTTATTARYNNIAGGSQSVNSDAYWSQQIGALKKFKMVHGHTRVSQRNAQDPSLARWVKKVREKYKKVQKGQIVPSLSPERIAELNAIGFIWIVRSSDFNVNFDRHFANLLEFKRQHGHTRVPHVYDQNLKLGRWCHHMKLSYHKLMKGEKPMIKVNQEHLDKLNKIGFQWQTRFVVASNKDGNKYDFDQGFMKLKAFQSSHGHCDVPTDYSNRSLVYWINILRSSYRQMSEGKRPIMRISNLQIRLLNEMKLDWTETGGLLTMYHNHGSLPWSIRYKQLCEYKARYGNSRVPSRYDDDRAFGNWVTSQRKALGRAVVGRDSTLTDEQRRKLEDIGLEWTVYKYDTDAGNMPKFNAKTKENRSKRKPTSRTKRKYNKRKPTSQFSSQHISNTTPKRRKKNIDDWVKTLGLGFEWNRREYRTISTDMWCRKLNLGFIFAETKKDKPKKSDTKPHRTTYRFENYIAELANFIERNGHCNVPVRDNKALCTWVSNIRTSYKRIQDGKPPLIKLTEDRMQSLKELDFDFRSHIRLKNRGPRVFSVSRENLTNHQDLLVMTHKSNSHATMRTDAISIDEWCKSLQLGFIWDANESREETHSPVRPRRMPMQNFDFYVKELKAFKAKNGHMFVRIADDKSLNAWVSRIRTSYNKIKAGEVPPVKLTEARMASLKEIGFSFENKRGRGRSKTNPLASPLKKYNTSIDLNAKDVNVIDTQNISGWCKNLGLGYTWIEEGGVADLNQLQESENLRYRELSDIVFAANLEQLKKFKAIHGHMDVTPKMNKSLNAWIRNIRMTYKRVQEGKSPLIKLTEERKQRLIEIDFDFLTHAERGIKIGPSSSSVNQPITHLELTTHDMNIWCQTLNLGFEWSTTSTKGTGKSWPQKHFESNLNELKLFIAKHGHMNVPVNVNKSLHYWVSNVKTSYNRIQTGRAPLIKLTDERMEALKNVGFVYACMKRKRRQSCSLSHSFTVAKKISMQRWCKYLGLGFEWGVPVVNNKHPSSPKSARKTFDQHLEDFKMYKQTHGHMNLLQMSKDNRPLSNWCRNIRSSYSRISAGKSGKGLRLTPESVQKLKSAGFEFASVSKATARSDDRQSEGKTMANPSSASGGRSQMVTFLI